MNINEKYPMDMENNLYPHVENMWIQIRVSLNISIIHDLASEY